MLNLNGFLFSCLMKKCIPLKKTPPKKPPKTTTKKKTQNKPNIKGNSVSSVTVQIQY